MGPSTLDDNIAAAFVRPAHPAPPTPHPLDELLAGATNSNPANLSLWDLWKEDYQTHDRDLFDQGFWAIAVHRFGNARMNIKNKVVRAPFSLLYKFLYKFVQWSCGISLLYTVKVGRRVRIWHHGGMILAAKSIGDDVHIRQNTTMGVAHRNDPIANKPIIEDRVDIGCGAVILGAITIGHDSMIGANAVVIRDVPPYSVAVGVPARIIKTLEPQIAKSSAA